MISKKKVYEFIEKVQLKAEQAIEKQYKEKKEAEVDKFLWEHPAFKKTVDDYQKSVECILSIRKSIAEEYDNTWLGNCGFYDNFSAREAFFKDNIFGNEKFDKISKERTVEVAKVRAEYRKIRKKCEELRNGDKGVEYLKSLNFDVSYFDKIDEVSDNDPVDVSVLFPCGNGKAD